MNGSYLCIEKARQVLAGLGHIESRTQFGGYSLSVDKVVFALISEGELYLRTSAALNQFMQQHPLMPFIFDKRGISVCLNYYKVDAVLWTMLHILLKLSQSALSEAQQCQLYKRSNIRLKDLPNMSIRYETLLREAGIFTVDELRQRGARGCWILMHNKNHHLGLDTLYALQGAISGEHRAVLSAKIREELRIWYQNYQKVQERSALRPISVRPAVS